MDAKGNTIIRRLNLKRKAVASDNYHHSNIPHTCLKILDNISLLVLMA